MRNRPLAFPWYRALAFGWLGLVVCLGIAASVGKSDPASLAQASLGLIVSVLFTLGPA